MTDVTGKVTDITLKIRVNRGIIVSKGKTVLMLRKEKLMVRSCDIRRVSAELHKYGVLAYIGYTVKKQRYQKTDTIHRY